MQEITRRRAIAVGLRARAPVFVRAGALLILVTDAPPVLLNVIAGVVYALAMPFVALTTAYVYFDRRTRSELEPERESHPSELPAEIQLSG